MAATPHTSSTVAAAQPPDLRALQFDAIQGLVMSGYGHLHHAGYLFLAVQDAARARQWLKARIPAVTNAVKPTVKPNTCLNIAFTAAGLAALGVPQAALNSFSTEFREGPAEPQRAIQMGDVARSAPAGWDYGGPRTPTIHILLAVFADTEDKRDSYRNEQRALLAEGGLLELHTQNGYRAPDSHEHFGFLDGIAQPTLKLPGAAPSVDAVEPGEFVLGYMTEYQHISAIPGLEALHSDVLGKNGTYLVYRKLAQDVPGLHDYLHSVTDGSQEQIDRLGAKMVGRWKSGASLVDRPYHDDPALGMDTDRNNAFQYFAQDPHGLACPIGAHIRRANPRDSLEPNPTESMKTVRRHSILRRGRSYGAPYDGTNAETPRGLLFICINADIKRQFEFIQEAWINDPHFNGMYDSKDPIVADRSEQRPFTSLIIPRAPYRETLHHIPQFVTMRGGGYFFLPGLPALEYIAGLNS
jgi:Dyp-type peroxidase family